MCFFCKKVAIRLSLSLWWNAILLFTERRTKSWLSQGCLMALIFFFKPLLYFLEVWHETDGISQTYNYRLTLGTTSPINHIGALASSTQTLVHQVMYCSPITCYRPSPGAYPHVEELYLPVRSPGMKHNEWSVQHTGFKICFFYQTY